MRLDNRPFRDSLTARGIPFNYLETTCQHNLSRLLTQDGTAAAAFQEECHATSVSVKLPFLKKETSLVYSNPAGDVLFLKPSNNFLPLQILLLDGQGALLQEAIGTDVLSNGLNVSGLPSGMFFVGVRTDRGMLFQKIIKT